MAGAIDTGTGDGGKKSLNVELNVVPFIDLMSCLTAFLLVTAVWTNLAQIPNKQKGIGRDAEKVLQEEPPPNASILLTSQEIWVGTTLGDRQQIRHLGEGQPDWEGLSKVVVEFKESATFSTREDIEIGAENDVNYQQIITAMDTAIAAGFPDIGLVDPQSLSVRFKQ